MSLFAMGDLLGRILLAFLPRRIARRIRDNTAPQTVYVLRDCRTMCTGEPRMTLFEGVFATLLFDLALFGTDNRVINGLIALFTRLQNSWDRPFGNEDDAAAKIDEFCARLGIQTDPWVWELEKRRYASLNDFFSRAYRAECRPAVGDGRVVAPACCKISCYRSNAILKSILIKNCDYSISEIGLPAEDLDMYAQNDVVLGYLSPKDYHRVHAPIAGKCIHCRMEGVDAPSASVKFFGGRFNLLNDNKRLVVVLEDEGENDGEEPLRVAMVVVGGVGVNTITYDRSLLGQSVAKGQEVSAFRAGGSAFAMFSTKPLALKKDIVESSLPVEVLVGETLAM